MGYRYNNYIAIWHPTTLWGALLFLKYKRFKKMKPLTLLTNNNLKFTKGNLIMKSNNLAQKSDFTKRFAERSLEKEKLYKHEYETNIESMFDDIYRLGYKHGVDETKIDYATSNPKGDTKIIKASQEDIKKHGSQLWGWCEQCDKPIEGRWVGSINYCPFCGRTVTKWEERGI